MVNFQISYYLKYQLHRAFLSVLTEVVTELQVPNLHVPTLLKMVSLVKIDICIVYNIGYK